MKQWLYFLVDEEGKSYTMQGGLLKKVSQKTPLTYTPDGWQDISIGWERDLAKIGIVRNFSVPLGFVLDGAEILRNIFYKSNVEAKVYLIIAKLETQVDLGSSTYRHHYKFFYKGELDLSTFKDELTKVTVRIMEGGLYKLLKANEGTVYEFGLDEPETVLVKMDGILLFKSSNFLIPEVEMATTTVPVAHLNDEGTSVYIATGNQNTDEGSTTYFLLNTGKDPVDFILNGSVKFQPNSSTDLVKVTLYKIDSVGGSTIVQEDTFDPVTGGVIYTANYVNLAATLESNEHLWLRLISVGTGSEVLLKESTIKADYETLYRETYIKAYKPFELYKKLGAKVLGSAASVYSSLLESKSMFVLTSGDAVRGLAGAKLKTNLNNFFEDCKVRYGAGMGIEAKKLVIELYAHFLTELDPIHLGNAKDLNITLATDLMGNTLKLGYNEKQIDDVNGKYSFANTHLYSSPITRIVKEQTFISPYIADPYVIELTRINLEGKTTTDNSKDNEVMILHVEENVTEFVVTDFTAIPVDVFVPGSTGTILFIVGHDEQQPNFQPGLRIQISGAPTNNGVFTVGTVGNVVSGFGFSIVVNETLTAEEMDGATIKFSHYTLARPVYDSITGVPDPDTIFNIALSPKRVAGAQRTWLQSMFAGFEGQQLTFQTTERNAELKTVLGSDVVEEKANIEIQSTKLFQPAYFEFDTEVPESLQETLDANPNRAFSFDWDNLTWIGFLSKAGIAPNTNKEQSYKLLAAPSNDLKLLI